MGRESEENRKRIRRESEENRKMGRMGSNMTSHQMGREWEEKGGRKKERKKGRMGGSQGSRARVCDGRSEMMRRRYEGLEVRVKRDRESVCVCLTHHK
jgi:hypothetical protein